MAETDHMNNPAGRLFLVFRELRLGRHQKQETVRNILLKFYGLDSDEQLMHHYAALCELPGRVRRAAAGHGLPAEMTKHLPSFEDRLMNMQLTAQAEGQLTKRIDVAQLDALEALSAYLASRSGGVVLEENEREALEKLLNELADAIDDAKDLPDIIANTLRESVGMMRHALSLSRILGTDPLLAETFRSVGAFAIHRRDFEQHLDSKPVRKFFEMVGYVASITEVVDKAHAIGIPEMLGLSAGS